MADLVFRGLADGAHLRLSWSLAGPLGAVEVWLRSHAIERSGGRWDVRGGIELHYHPDQLDRGHGETHGCVILGDGACRHEGTSLGFDDQVRPHLRVDDTGRVLLDADALAVIDRTARAWAAANLTPATEAPHV